MPERENIIPFNPSVPEVSGNVILGEGQRLFTPEGVVRGPSAVPSPVAPEPPPPPQPLDAIEFFNMRQPIEDTMLTRAIQKEWFDNFQRDYHKQRFNTLDDYIDYVTGIQSQVGENLSVREILPFIQKQAMEFMPTKMKQELQSKMAQVQEETRFNKLRSDLTRLNSDPTNKEAGIVYGIKNGQIEMKQRDPNLDFKRKQEISKGIADVLKSHNTNKPKRSDFKREGDVDDSAAYSEALLQWRTEKQELMGAWSDAIDLSRAQDIKPQIEASAQEAEGQPEYQEGDILFNPDTNQRLQLRGNQWLPVD